jgi:hypothetical protein
MTQWSLILLLAYVVLGLIAVAWRKSGRIAVLVTVVTLTAAMAQYGALR